jgi:hypothetical protein
MDNEKQKRRLLVESLGAVLCLAFSPDVIKVELFGENPKVNQSARTLQEFSNLVQAYVTLHRKQESSLPPLKQTPESAKIVEHQQLLASKIRSARANAAEGEIFTADVRKAFLPIVRRHFQGPYARPAQLTIRQGNPVKLHLNINESYPEGLPWTTVPPSLLQNLPRLPHEVEYRIVDRDLIVWDVKANLVVDILRQAIP